MEKTQIKNIKFDRKNKIVAYEGKLIVKSIGNAGHIVLPKQLIGKRVCVYYDDKDTTGD